MSESFDNKTEFVKFLIRNGMLKVGDFTYKSGRKGPYFLNIGVGDGMSLEFLTRFYAEMVKKFLKDNPEITSPVLFGPAYKGIPLVVGTALKIGSLRYCFNRKEAKDHGEGGSLVGYKLKKGDNVIILEDVTTAGMSISEVAPIIESCGANLVAVLTAVDRMETGKVKRASVEIAEKFGCEYRSIMNVAEVMNIVRKIQTQSNIIIDDDLLAAIRAYFEKWAPDALATLDN